METQTQYQISPEDIEFLNQKYHLVFTYPAAAFTISALILKSTKFLSFPKFFRNPLESPEGNALFYTRLQIMAKLPLLLYGACVGGSIGLFQYELVKYHMFLKYKTLGKTYLNAFVAVYVSELKRVKKNKFNKKMSILLLFLQQIKSLQNSLYLIYVQVKYQDKQVKYLII